MHSLTFHPGLHGKCGPPEAELASLRGNGKSDGRHKGGKAAVLQSLSASTAERVSAPRPRN
jgi:hypothetical protein